METTAINSVYVVYVWKETKNAHIRVLERAFFREDEAERFCKTMNRILNHKDLNNWFYTYEELEIE